MRSLTVATLFVSILAGSAAAQDAAPAESHKGALPQPVGTTNVQSPAGVTRTDGAETKAGNTLPGTVVCQSASAEMTNGKTETCAK